jgi:chitin disaccharide deacetylase
VLIINADDLGRNKTCTDNSIRCFEQEAITSASAMVFMADSERAAELSLIKGLDVGLHLNLDVYFSASGISESALKCHGKVVSYLTRATIFQLIYNPVIRTQFSDDFKYQCDEYERIFGKILQRIDGHHHLHLCMNMLIDCIIPRGHYVRRNLSFGRGEKNAVNRYYRRIVDFLLEKRYRCTDYFYSLPLPKEGIAQLPKIIDLAQCTNVELMVHPERIDEFEYLLSNEFNKAISGIKTGVYSDIY